MHDVFAAEEYARLLIAAADCNCARISTRVYAPEPERKVLHGARWSSWATFDGARRERDR